MKKILFFLLFLLFALPNLKAQINAPVIYTPHFHWQAARYQPSKLGLSSTKIDIHVAPLMGIQAWAGNTSLSLEKIVDLLDTETITTEDVDEKVNDLDPINRVGFGAYIQPLSLSLKFFKNETLPSDTSQSGFASTKVELFTISLDLTERVEGTALVSDVVGQLAWNGNAQFAGQTVSIGENSVDAFWQREIAIGAALPVWRNRDFDIRAGGRVKYIIGVASVHTDVFENSLTTPALNTANINSQLDFGLNYRVNKAFSEDDWTSSDVISGTGKGFGLDLGGTLTFQQRYRASLSILDIGSVRYTKEVENYYRQGDASFAGVELDFDSNQDDSDFLDSLWNELEPLESQEAFTMPLPTRLSLQLEYGVPAQDKNNLDYFRHQAFLTYTQGFRDIGASTKKSQFNLAYTYSSSTRFSVGTTLGLGGYYGFAWGTYLSAQLGAFDIGLGSGNLLGAFSQRTARGVDVSFNMGLSFR